MEDVEAAYRLAFWQLVGAGPVDPWGAGDWEALPFYWPPWYRRRGRYPEEYPPTPIPHPVPPWAEVRVERLRLASPLEVLTAIPTEAVAAPLLWYVVKNIESILDAPDRIRIRRVRREREFYEESQARDEARESYLAARRRRRGYRFELEEGEAAEEEAE